MNDFLPPSLFDENTSNFCKVTVGEPGLKVSLIFAVADLYPGAV